jgi:hypothetical protein
MRRLPPQDIAASLCFVERKLESRCAAVIRCSFFGKLHVYHKAINESNHVRCLPRRSSGMQIDICCASAFDRMAFLQYSYAAARNKT